MSKFIRKYIIIVKKYIDEDGELFLQKYNSIVEDFDTLNQAKEKLENIRETMEDIKGYEVFTYKDNKLKIMLLDGFEEVKIVEI